MRVAGFCQIISLVKDVLMTKRQKNLSHLIAILMAARKSGTLGQEQRDELWRHLRRLQRGIRSKDLREIEVAAEAIAKSLLRATWK